MHRLTNDSDVQTVALRLNKHKPRELELRAYLDSRTEYGINRPETILQMFEILKEHDLLGEYPGRGSIVAPEKEVKKTIDKVKVDTDDIDMDMIDNI